MNQFFSHVLKWAKVEHKVDVIEFSLVFVGFTVLVFLADGMSTILGLSLALIWLLLIEVFAAIRFRRKLFDLKSQLKKKSEEIEVPNEEAISALRSKGQSFRKNLVICAGVFGTLLLAAFLVCNVYFRTWLENRWTRPALLVMFVSVLVPQIYLMSLLRAYKEVSEASNSKLES